MQKIITSLYEEFDGKVNECLKKDWKVVKGTFEMKKIEKKLYPNIMMVGDIIEIYCSIVLEKESE